jgi:uncharacterized membrane protein YeaQ/YmgE (transglycosylase-associated protein family)
MGIIANMLIPGRRSQGLIRTCVIGVAGAAVFCLPPMRNGGCTGIEEP